MCGKHFFFSPQIANPQILGLLRYRNSANIFGVPVFNCKSAIDMINPKIAYPQISTKYCTILSKNSLRGSRLKNLLCTNLNFRNIYNICKEQKYVFADLQTTQKIRSANRKSATFFRRSANLTHHLSPQTCGFAICTFGNHVPSKPTIVVYHVPIHTMYPDTLSHNSPFRGNTFQYCPDTSFLLFIFPHCWTRLRILHSRKPITLRRHGHKRGEYQPVILAVSFSITFSWDAKAFGWYSEKMDRFVTTVE
jgi:hypothetical protein